MPQEVNEVGKDGMASHAGGERGRESNGAGGVQRTFLGWRRNCADSFSLRDGEQRENKNAWGRRGNTF